MGAAPPLVCVLRGARFPFPEAVLREVGTIVLATWLLVTLVLASWQLLCLPSAPCPPCTSPLPSNFAQP